MSFDLERFRSAQLGPREADVRVQDLAHWFADGAPPVWRVRGLTGEEIARSNEASQRHETIASAVEAFAAASGGDKAGALSELIGYSGSVPADLAKRFDHLVFGSIEPKIDREIAVRLFKDYPVVGFHLTNRILELTGLGPDVGKLPPSGETPG